MNGDGIRDVYISNGGGFRNIEDYPNFDSWLFWGEKQIDPQSGEEVTIFKGGREEARKANVEMFKGRGRFNHLFDANNDGLLDIFSSQDRRVDNGIVLGVLLINQGNKTWKEHNEMREYSNTMILTDADGDGYAQEFLIQRGFCYPSRSGPAVDETLPSLCPYDNKVKKFCLSRPVGTPAIYNFNDSTKTMKRISKSYRNFWPGDKWSKPCCPNGAYSGSKTLMMIKLRIT